MLRGQVAGKWKKENGKWEQEQAAVVSLCGSWGTAWHQTDLA